MALTSFANFSTGSTTSTAAQTLVRNLAVTLPIPAPQSTPRVNGLSTDGFEESWFRSLARKLDEPCKSMRETWGNPPSIPLTVAETLFQYLRESSLEMLPSGGRCEVVMDRVQGVMYCSFMILVQCLVVDQ